jgi:hypothetical protein
VTKSVLFFTTHSDLMTLFQPHNSYEVRRDCSVSRVGKDLEVGYRSPVQDQTPEFVWRPRITEYSVSRRDSNQVQSALWEHT